MGLRQLLLVLSLLLHSWKASKLFQASPAVDMEALQLLGFLVVLQTHRTGELLLYLLE